MIHLDLEDKDMDYLASLLMQRPMGEVLPLWTKIVQQIQAQQPPGGRQGALNGSGATTAPPAS